MTGSGRCLKDSGGFAADPEEGEGGGPAGVYEPNATLTDSS